MHTAATCTPPEARQAARDLAQETTDDSPDRLGITLNWHRDRRDVEIALRKAIAESYKSLRRQREPASTGPEPPGMAGWARPGGGNTKAQRLKPSEDRAERTFRSMAYLFC
jgi:hypothetical protein